MTVSPPILVISLQGSSRLDPLTQGLTGRGLTYAVVPATDLREATEDALAELANQHTARLVHGAPLTGGQVGCVLSHRKAYEIFLTTDSEWAVILEDDARPHPEFGSFVQRLGLVVASKPTIVCLYAGLWNRQPLAKVRVLAGVALQPALFPPTGTVGYAINRSAAARALRSGTRVTTRADWPTWSQGVTFLVTQPQLIWHEYSETTVGDAHAMALPSERRAPALLRLIRLLSEPSSSLELHRRDSLLARLRFVVRGLVVPSAARRLRRYVR